MTRDEVMALSDEDLSNLAASLLGRDAVNDRAAGVFDPAHDIAAAWKLVKQLERDGFKVSVHTGMINPMTGDVLDDSSAAIWNHDDIYWVGTAGPGESSLAITRAFVIAMTQEKP